MVHKISLPAWRKKLPLVISKGDVLAEPDVERFGKLARPFRLNL